MKKLLVAAGAASFLAITSVAALADQANGTITTVDTKNGTVTLNDGKTYIVPLSVPASSLGVGSVVTITYTSDPATGKMLATDIVVKQADNKT